MDCARPAPHSSCPGLGCGSDGGCQQLCLGAGHWPWHRPGMGKGSSVSRGAKAGKSAYAASTAPLPGLGRSEPPSPGTPEGGTQGSQCDTPDVSLAQGQSWGQTAWASLSNVIAEPGSWSLCPACCQHRVRWLSTGPASPFACSVWHTVQPPAGLATHGLATGRVKSRAAWAAPGRAGGAAGRQLDTAFLVPPRRGG